LRVELGRKENGDTYRNSAAGAFENHVNKVFGYLYLFSNEIINT
jgi:hypothetical protein